MSINFQATTRCHAALMPALFCLALAGCVSTPEPIDTPASTAANPAVTVLQAPADPPLSAPELGERALFNGVDLGEWRETAFCKAEDAPQVTVTDDSILLAGGTPQTGITWDGDFPHDHYEVRLEAARLQGSDFFCGMTFPVGNEYCTLIVGGWGGMVVGLSNVDGMSAAENETTLGMNFDLNRWYRIRLRVDSDAIRVWIDGDLLIDLAREGHHFDIWSQQRAARPFGINTWYTAAALRGIRLRELE